MAGSNWDWADLNFFMSDPEIEGRSSRRLHYPENNPGESGPTVARGFDIGQHSIQDLNRIFNPKKDSVLISKLAPFAGKTGREAWNLVLNNRNTFILTPQEENTIIEKVIKSKVSPVIKAFNEDTKIGAEFKDLPFGLKNIITSVGYHMGIDGIRDTNLWNQITTGKWSELEKNMDAFGMGKEVDGKWVVDESGNRRRKKEWKKSGLTVDFLNKWQESKTESRLINNWYKEDNPLETSR